MNTRQLSLVPAPTTPTVSFTPARGRLLQRKCACGGTPGPIGECEKCRKRKLQRRRGDLPAPSLLNYSPSPVSEVPPIVHDVLRSSGQPLDAGTRAFFEPRFGHDFSRVRVHTDAQAAESARGVNAAAYTVGSDVVFSHGQYSFGTKNGRELLAHELTHVVQQSEIRPDLQNLRIGASNSDHERQAEGAMHMLQQDGVNKTLPLVFSKSSRPTIMRSELLSSTVQICHRLLESREFNVSKGGIRVNIDARWQGPTEGASSCESYRETPYHVTLSQKGLLWDSEYGTCPFDPQGPSQRQWTGLPSDKYYLTIWTNNSNPNCCLEGDIEVSEEAGLTGESCTEIPDDALSILHTALDVAGLIPVLGALPDAVNAGVYAIEGDWVSAGISAAAMIPIFGEGVTVTKLGVKVTRSAVKRVGKEAKAAGKKTIQKEAGRAGKELVEEGAEQAARQLIGRTGRNAFGETTFKGLVKNRPLSELTHNELYQAFRETPFTPSSHTIKRLREARTSNLGITTLADFAQHLNYGVVSAAEGGAIAIEYGSLKAIVDPVTKIIITVRP